MTPADLRVVFMGTPEFAVPSLEALFDLGCDVRAVVSQPDRPKGRGQKVEPTPVAACGARHGARLFQWERLSNESYEALSALAPDLCVVTAYGKILPRRYLDLPRLGCLNVHASLLPRWRGAAPIQWAVIEGDTETGVSIMRMDVGMDTGDVALMRRTPIGPDETSGELHDRLSQIGASALKDAVRALCAGELRFETQPSEGVTVARRLEKEDGRIDWSWPAKRVHDRVRGTTPWPGAYVDFTDGPLKIHATRVADGRGEPGAIIAHDPDGPRVACGEGAVTLLRVQRAGRKPVGGAEFLRGERALSRL
jgi:methionyl-tRNA formyltransferase